jgi:hypothetical protein
MCEDFHAPPQATGIQVLSPEVFYFLMKQILRTASVSVVPVGGILDGSLTSIIIVRAGIVRASGRWLRVAACTAAGFRAVQKHHLQHPPVPEATEWTKRLRPPLCFSC